MRNIKKFFFQISDKINKKNAVIFESSDDDDDSDKDKEDDNEKEKGDGSGENSEKSSAPQAEATAVNEAEKTIEMEVDKDGATNEKIDSNSLQEAIKVQQSLVDYIKVSVPNLFFIVNSYVNCLLLYDF